MALRFGAARTRSVTAPLAARAFSGTAADHEPPIKLFGIPARYANATFVAASKKGELDTVQRDLDAFQHIIDKSTDFKSFLTNPTISRGAKVDMIDKAFDAKSKTSSITKNLLLTMAGNARLGDTEKVIDAYSRLLKAKKGIVEAVVTTAEPLSPQQEKALHANLAEQAGKGKTLSLTMETNPDIVGGLTVQIGDKYLDLSISSKITAMKNLMQDSVASK